MFDLREYLVIFGLNIGQYLETKELMIVDDELMIVFDPNFLGFFDGRIVDDCLFWPKRINKQQDICLEQQLAASYVSPM